eukprot:6175342-Pleurochrysis_carterae.AAC.1
MLISVILVTRQKPINQGDLGTVVPPGGALPFAPRPPRNAIEQKSLRYPKSVTLRGATDASAVAESGGKRKAQNTRESNFVLDGW